MNRLSFASGIVPEFGPVDTVLAAAAGGFDAVGLWIEPSSWTTQTTRDVRAVLADTGLELLDAEVLWLKPDADIDAHRRSIDIAAELGAKNVLCVSSAPDQSATAAWLADLCRHAEGTGIRVALEFGIFTEVKNLKMALAILDAVAHPQRAVLVDPIHVDRSGTTLAEIAAIPNELLPYAQFCDALAQRPDPANFNAIIEDAIDLRQQCGEGALPLAALLEALPKDIPLSVELRSKALREHFPDPADRAREVARMTRQWLKANAASLLSLQ